MRLTRGIWWNFLGNPNGRNLKKQNEGFLRLKAKNCKTFGGVEGNWETLLIALSLYDLYIKFERW